MRAIRSSWVALLLASMACNGGPKRASDAQPSQAAAGSCDQGTSGCNGATTLLHATNARANASQNTEPQTAGAHDETAAEDDADDSDQEANDAGDGDQDVYADEDADDADAGHQGKHAEHADGSAHGEHGEKAAHAADAGADDQEEANDRDETDG